MKRVYRSQAEWLGATVEAHVEAFAEAGIALWRCTGVITTEMLPALMVDAFAWHEEWRALATLCDFRGAAISAPLERVVWLAGVLIQPPRAIAAPMVIVPAEEEVDYFRRYASRMRERSVTRLVEPELSEAETLVRRIAQAREADGFLVPPVCQDGSPSQSPAPPPQKPSRAHRVKAPRATRRLAAGRTGPMGMT